MSNRAILKLNSNGLHFVRHNIGKSETLSEFPEFDKSNSPLPLIKLNSCKDKPADTLNLDEMFIGSIV